MVHSLNPLHSMDHQLLLLLRCRDHLHPLLCLSMAHNISPLLHSKAELESPLQGTHKGVAVSLDLCIQDVTKQELYLGEQIPPMGQVVTVVLNLSLLLSSTMRQ